MPTASAQGPTTPEDTPVARRLRKAIEAHGPLRFSRFLETALYAPGAGYYMRPVPPLGEAGDYVTAPELSPVFARCLARALAPVLAETGGDLLELGAGRGTLAKDLLWELDRLDALPGTYRILDVSGALRATQADTLASLPESLGGRVAWLDRLPPDGFRGVVLANEVADALVFEVFRVGAADPVYRGVDIAEDRLIWVDLPADDALRSALGAIEQARRGPLPAGYVSEVRPMLEPWIGSLCDILTAGALVIVDYGLPRAELYADERAAGTLKCFARQRSSDDPFVRPGEQDITAWVDFTSVASAATEAGLVLEGFTTQAAFLIENGYTDYAARLSDTDDPVRRIAAQSAARRLVMPGDMGERFRVLAASRGLQRPMTGFATADLTRTL